MLIATAAIFVLRFAFVLGRASAMASSRAQRIQERVKELGNMLRLNNQTIAANKLDIAALLQMLQTTGALRAWLPPTMPPDVEAAVAVVDDMNSAFWVNEGIIQQLEVMAQSQKHHHLQPAGYHCHHASDAAEVIGLSLSLRPVLHGL